jgi:hypothetical protein
MILFKLLEAAFVVSGLAISTLGTSRIYLSIWEKYSSFQGRLNFPGLHEGTGILFIGLIVISIVPISIVRAGMKS